MPARSRLASVPQDPDALDPLFENPAFRFRLGEPPLDLPAVGVDPGQVQPRQALWDFRLPRAAQAVWIPCGVSRMRWNSGVSRGEVGLTQRKIPAVRIPAVSQDSCGPGGTPPEAGAGLGRDLEGRLSRLVFVWDGWEGPRRSGGRRRMTPSKRGRSWFPQWRQIDCTSFSFARRSGNRSGWRSGPPRPRSICSEGRRSSNGRLRTLSERIAKRKARAQDSPQRHGDMENRF